MSTSLSDLQAMRDSLLAARMAGLREVRDSNGEAVVYKSDGEMAAALNRIDRLIAEQSAPTPTTIVFRTSKGIF